MLEDSRYNIMANSKFIDDFYRDWYIMHWVKEQKKFVYMYSIFSSTTAKYFKIKKKIIYFIFLFSDNLSFMRENVQIN